MKIRLKKKCSLYVSQISFMWNVQRKVKRHRACSILDPTNYKVRRVRVAKIVGDVAILQSANAIRNVPQLLHEIFGIFVWKK